MGSSNSEYHYNYRRAGDGFHGGRVSPRQILDYNMPLHKYINTAAITDTSTSTGEDSITQPSVGVQAGLHTAGARLLSADVSVHAAAQIQNLYSELDCDC